ncbi:MAG: AAA family ATPase [Anaerolineales bacterium]|nr:AAA family ATPase [Anaerolineales bacterium]
MSNQEKLDINAVNGSTAVGSISVGGDIGGDINIGNTGYTADQVSILLTQIQSTFQPKPFDGRCPYKGLDVFEEEDAELFFGREKLVDDLVSRVKDSRTVFVTGPSGSGKSSLVRAGLIHALKQGAIKGSERWLYATMKPGRDPIGELGRVVSSLASSTNPEDEIRAKAMKDATIFARWCEIVLKEGRDKRLVLFIDQFEEVFTQISKEEERIAFLNLLTHAATIENGRVIILFSMRSDFVSNCATYPQLNALLNQQFVQIGAMQPEELVSAIAQPALRVGLRIDPDLIAQIINEMKGEPGALPLMQFALKDLFDSQQEKSGVPALTLNDYLQRGGIHKALERHADDSFSKLSRNEQELARSIFSGLIEIGRGTQDTKRTALFDELVPANTKAEDIEAIVQKLADARLITTDESAGRDTVTISHEKLIDAWPWLKKLVNENRDVIALQNEISADAKEWEEHKRDTSYLYTGGRLANVREQVKKQKLALTHLAQEFIRTGSTRQKRRQVLLTSASSVILIAAILASVVFRNQAQSNIEIANTAQAASTFAIAQQETAKLAQAKAEEQANIALARQLSSQALPLYSNENPEQETAVLLATQSMRLFPHSEAAQILQSNTLANLITETTQNSEVHSVAFSPDGDLIVSGGCDKYDENKVCIQGSAHVWEAITGKGSYALAT